MSQLPLTSVEVFVPNDYPRHTYVDRSIDPPLEEALRRGLSTPKEVISVSGPSKSGKTVLIERVVGIDNLITVSGSEINTTESLWERVLDWMGAPSTSSKSTSESSATGKTGSLGISGGVLMGVIKGQGSASTQSTDTDTNSISTSYTRRGMSQVREEIADSSFCILLDDFHYIPRELQKSVGEQIKTAAGRGIRVITASVPHRSDDVVRSNSELRGRTVNIDTGYWEDAELIKIAKLGFSKLRIQITDEIIARLAANACGSPQLMQRICLNICNDLKVKEALPVTRYVSGPEIDILQVFAITSTSADFKTLVQTMHSGPKTRGTERNKYRFTDGSRGDVYRCILLAIAQDPPRMELRYPELMDRIKLVCCDEIPVGRGVSEACTQISDFAAGDRTIEFDTDQDVEVLHISDPYWLFYLRSSRKLKDLAKEWWKV